jgi:hypothetical protein
VDGAVLSLLALSAAMFLPVLKGSWLADDFSWVKQFSSYPWGDVGRLFLGHWERAVAHEYRPLWAISFVVDLGIWGLRPVALHLTNLGLHLLAGVLVWRLAGSATGSRGPAALLALAFFAVAPLHAEPVAWISARGHVLAPIFVLAAMLLLRRFERTGRRATYLAALVGALAAFGTQEVAVALPPLLLLRDLLDHPPRNGAGIRRIALLHLPFWLLLAAYLGLRYLLFGMLGRPGIVSSIPELLRRTGGGLRHLWLDPVASLGVPGGAAGRLLSAGLCLLILFLLLAGLFATPSRERGALARSLTFFALAWPLVTTAVLFGADSSRHFYLASVGVSIALGLAGARLLCGRTSLALAGSAAIGLLVGMSAFGLGSNIAQYARSGRLSRALAAEVGRALAGAGADPRAVSVIVADYPERRVVFWDYFYPEALMPPFRPGPLPPGILPSFAPCHCSPEEWKAEHAATIARLRDGDVSSVRIVEWEAWRSAFVTRVLTPSEFWEGGDAAPDGPLLRPRRPGLPSPRLP